jgi:cold-inducible RNA-binding protein
MKKLFVSNLPYSVRDDELAEIFADFGPIVSAVVIVERDSGRSKGFGFVEIEDDAKAEEAIAKLNGTDFQGRNLNVNEARPKEERPRRDFNGGGNRGGGNGGSFRQGNRF